MKPLLTSKKSLEGERSSWLAEKTALKQEVCDVLRISLNNNVIFLSEQLINK